MSAAPRTPPLPGEPPQEWSARVLAERDDYNQPYRRFVPAPVPPPKKRRHAATTPRKIGKCSPKWWVDQLGYDAAVELAREFAADTDATLEPSFAETAA